VYYVWLASLEDNVDPLSKVCDTDRRRFMPGACTAFEMCS
jgi:hypothetical protein